MEVKVIEKELELLLGEIRMTNLFLSHLILLEGGNEKDKPTIISDANDSVITYARYLKSLNDL